VVRRLKRKGLLQRRRTKEDARAYAVRLTEEGKQVLRAAEPLARCVDERVLDALPVKRRAEFMGALASIVRTPNSGFFEVFAPGQPRGPAC
jgi:DNA-binding MarR family transcriptional regulator